tara:strand:- start:384 stop:581 length:198 start_codon:yes stop_codon:yes gene_type:complete
MLFIAQKNVPKKNNLKITLIVTDNRNIKKDKIKTKEKLRTSRIKRLENQLKSNILKRKIAKKNNG